MIFPTLLIHDFINIAYTSRIIDILLMGFCGIIMLIIYYFVSVYFGLPQVIFGIKEVNPKAILKRFRA